MPLAPALVAFCFSSDSSIPEGPEYEKIYIHGEIIYQILSDYQDETTVVLVPN